MFARLQTIVGTWIPGARLILAGLSVVAIFFTAYLPAPAVAQFAVAIAAGEEEEDEEGEEGDEPAQRSFLLPSQPTDIAEAMTDFQRLSGRQQWEKAFKELEKVLNSPAQGLVPGDGGIMLPGRSIVQGSLAELPAAGKDAYRLFYDPQAKKLLEEAQGAAEREKLTQVVSTYLITTVGDVAADRLGDLEFEAGNFLEAIEAWRSILLRRPDSRIPRGRLFVKIGTALARENRWEEFRELQQLAAKDQPDQKISVGGREATVEQHLSQMAQHAPVQTAVVNVSTLDILPVGERLKLAWQYRLIPKLNRGGKEVVGLQVRSMYGQPQASDAVFPCVADDSRLYVNYLGRELHIDLQSGKLLWRSGKFFELIAKAGQGFLVLEQYGLAVDGDNVWSVAGDPSKIGTHEQPKFALRGRSAATGKDVLNGFLMNGLKEWSVRGTPLPSGDRVYVTAAKENSKDLHVMAVHPKEKKVLWSQSLGSYTSEPQQHMYTVGRTFQPSLLLDGSRLFVDTHGGAVVQLDAGNGRIQWGLNYESETIKMNRFWGGNMQTTPRTISPPLLVDGVLYVKGMLANRLYAIDPVRPRVLWKRSVPQSSTLLGVDAARLYLGGEDICAYDLKTRKLLWSVRVNIDSSYAQPLLTRSRIYHFGSRGILEINKTTGHVDQLYRGDDLDSLGGRLVVASGKLLAISNLAISAYDLETDKTDKRGAAAAPAEKAPPPAASGSNSN